MSDTDEQSRPATDPTECDVTITPEMIDAGVSALYNVMGYSLELGSPEAGVDAVFRAMLRSCLIGASQPSASTPATR
jgi:hypothetical protein